ncbi:MAG: DUF3147 family protein [Verrucomicrobiota bacterium]
MNPGSLIKSGALVEDSDSIIVPILLKVVLSALIIVVVSEIVIKRGAWLGSLIASLPILSIITFFWIYRGAGESERVEKLASHSTGIFWFVLPSLPLFLFFPFLLRKGLPFWASLGLGCLLTILLYLIMIAILKKFGVTI